MIVDASEERVPPLARACLRLLVIQLQLVNAQAPCSTCSLPIIFFTPLSITGVDQQNSTTATSDFFNRIDPTRTFRWAELLSKVMGPSAR